MGGKHNRLSSGDIGHFPLDKNLVDARRFAMVLSFLTVRL